MSRYAFMPLYWADFLADTDHLSNEELGAYTRLLGAMWERGGTVPDDDKYLAWACHCSYQKWSRLKPVIMQFLTPAEGGNLTNRRMARVVARCRARSELATQSATARWQARSKKNNDLANATAYANAMQRARVPDPDMFSDKSENTSLPSSSLRSFNGREEARLSNGKASRLPEDFRPDVTYAMQQGLTEQQATAEAEGFIDYWRAKAKDNTKLDWPATWRTWVRRVVGTPLHRAHSSPEPVDEIEAYRRKLREEERRNAKH